MDISGGIPDSEGPHPLFRAAQMRGLLSIQPHNPCVGLLGPKLSIIGSLKRRVRQYSLAHLAE